MRHLFSALEARIEEAERSWLRDVHSWAAAQTDALWLDRVEPYRNCRVAGVVRTIRLDPAGGALDTTITDGVSSLSARWKLRRPLPQLKAGPGMGLILEGASRVDPDGRLLLIEPTYEICPGPDHQ